MIQKSTLLKIALGVVGVVGAFAAFLLWLADPWNLRAPSDARLVATFHEHRDAFENLRDMATVDRVPYITASDVEGELSEARKQQYKHLVSEIYSGLRVRVDYGRVTRFIFGEGGLSAISGGWLKGIEYVEGDYRREGPIVENLDDARSLPPSVYLREIEPNWFIVYQRTVD